MLPRDWIVDLGLDGNDGPRIAFSKWLHSRIGEDATRLIAAHVVESGRFGGEPLSAAERARLEAQLREHVAALGGNRCFGQLCVLSSRRAEDALSRLASPPLSHALVITRRPGPSFWIRPRRVRRLVRRVPGPLLVLPPDYTAPRGSAGPVVVAAGHDDSSDRAEGDARRLAANLQLRLLSVQAVPATPSHAPPSPSGNPDRVAPGRPAATLADIARQEDASLIVCGSRGLGPAERLFLRSVSTGLAARATRPVLILPAPDTVGRGRYSA